MQSIKGDRLRLCGHFCQDHCPKRHRPSSRGSLVFLCLTTHLISRHLQLMESPGRSMLVQRETTSSKLDVLQLARTFFPDESKVPYRSLSRRARVGKRSARRPRWCRAPASLKAAPAFRHLQSRSHRTLTEDCLQ